MAEFLVDAGELVGVRAVHPRDAARAVLADWESLTSLPSFVDVYDAAGQLASRVLIADEMCCEVCGCTDSNACPGGCYWVAINLCSRCA